MAKQTKSGFVIKLSCETVQKLAEEDQQAKSKESASSDVPEPEPGEKNEAEDCEMKSDSTCIQNALAEVRTEVNDDEKSKSLLPKKLTINSKEKANIVTTENKRKLGDESNPESTNAWGDYAPFVTYEGDQAIYTDPSTQQKYSWNKENNSWDPMASQTGVPGREYSYEDDTHVYTEPDGSKFFWDMEKKAWIPKVDDDFLAFYQMSYGFVDNTSNELDKKEDDKKQDGRKKEVQKHTVDPVTGVKRKNEPQWFEPSDDTNTKVYVSNLPLDLTEEEFVNFMQKCGLVERDPSTQKMKVKLYMDKEYNCFKGDALCTYIKIESVDLALKLLDGSDLKGNKIKVERAHFQLKGEYNPALKPKKKKKKELEKLKKMQQKLFDWRPEKFLGERSKHERVVIVKNLFHPSDFDKEVQLILDYQQDLREECSKAGEVRKVVIYDRHPEGVAQITMKEPEMADAVIQLINGRWFGKKQITAEIWDGKTKYKIAETDADINQRIDKWGKFLEGKEDEASKEKQATEKNFKSGTSAENINSKTEEVQVSSETIVQNV
ncbi:HIV Tat-specific factor 1 [Pectinophora gossypiella]|uniref:HIV Tat-specific factor 1 n=1 Tax=Pectinophora gossypiella TaxID=13191 RepID=UPI00214EC358|nr:HIV Tat-specific factor 1 [Pectinophora gossypiella]